MANKDLITPELGLKQSLKEALIQECQTLYNINGILKPADLVTVASNPDNPLHHIFEWDDEKAANKHREEQARVLIRLVKIETSKGESIPHYVNVKFEKNGEQQRGYMPVDVAMKQKTLKEQILKAAASEIRYWESKYQGYEELAGVVNESKIEEVEATLN